MILFFCLLLLTTILAALYMSAGKAYANIAVGNTSPLLGSSSRGTPWHAVGTGAFDGKYSWSKVYVPVGESATIVVDQACNLDVGTPSVTYYMEDLASGGNKATETYSDGDWGNRNYHESRSNSGTCNSRIQFPEIKSNEGTPSAIPGHQTYRAFYFVAKIDAAPGDNERSFRITSYNPRVVIGESRPIDGGYFGFRDLSANFFSIYQRDAPGLGGQTWDYYIDIAPTCNEAENNVSKSIVVYDADEGVYSPQDIKLVVQRSPRQTNPNWSNYETFENLGGNHEQVSRSLDWNNQYMYRIRILNINWHNTVQIRLPYDQFDATPTGNSGDKCNKARVTPQSQVRRNGGDWLDKVTVVAGDTIEYRHRVTKSGNGCVSFTSDRYNLFGGVNVNGGPSANNACGSEPWSQPTGPIPVASGLSDGQEFCEHILVKPTGDTEATGNPSNPACAKVRNEPEVPPGVDMTVVSRDCQHWAFEIEAEPGQTVCFRTTMAYSESRETPTNPNAVLVAMNSNYRGTYYSNVQMMSNGQQWTFTGTYTIPNGDPIVPVQRRCESGAMMWQYVTGTDPDTGEDIKAPQAKTTNEACVVTVGGKSAAKAISNVHGADRNIAEQGQPVRLIGSIDTSPFYRKSLSYSYQLACNYIVRWNGVDQIPMTGCDRSITDPGDVVVGTYDFTIPDDAPMGSQLCMTISIQSLGSAINGPNPNFILTPETTKCVTVVGGKSSVSASSLDTAEPTDSVTFTGSINTGNYYSRDGYYYTVGCNYTIKYMRAGYGGGTSTIDAGNCTTGVYGNGSLPFDKPYTIPNSTSYIGNQICMFVNIWAGGSTINDPNGNLMGFPTNASTCMEIVARPYTKVYGGDTTAGSGFSVGGGACINSSASVVGWNRWTGGYYKGSGAQLAIFANNTIKGFGSGQNLTRNTTQVPGSAFGPANLSFANTGILPFTDNGGGDGLGATYGGSFGGGSCIPDYYSGMPTTPPPPAWVSIDDSNVHAADDGYAPKAYRVPAASTPLELGGAGGNLIVNGNSTTLYVDGNVYITGNITGASGTATVAQIPVFTVIARGNIYIAPNVTKLFGTYIAQPKDGSTGKIYTCASGSTPLVPNKSNYATCGNQLVVTGSFVADKVHLYRNNGSMYQDDGGKVPASTNYTSAAEVFQYNPLNWIRGSLSSVTQSNTTYDAITSLPPVL